jgi:hypothetical protein
MNNCLPLHIPREPCKPLGRSAEGHTEARPAFRRSAHNISHLSLGCGLLSPCGTTEAKPLVLMLFRALGAMAHWFRPLPKSSAKDQLLLHKAEGHSQGEAGTSDLDSTSAVTEPSRNRRDRSFRGIWAQSKSSPRRSTWLETAETIQQTPHRARCSVVGFRAGLG